ncbi:MAG: alpha/beta hydrolase, partial [Methylococcaceae bacterium]|nr:alpha/beta hydrolase [Methylococcaceae bacterium]MCI0732589.1 alpha/beta hydrolase [Methylococcaceae bacterium]
MSKSKLSAIEINPSSRANASIIWLHGLGANGHDFEPVVPYLGLPAALAVRFLFPHAPERPVTVNQGYVMRAWYDIAEISINRKIDHAGIRASVEQIHQLIDYEIANGIAAGRIILAGFSQGGVIALEAGLGFRVRIAGIIGLSTYLADKNAIPSGDLPIFLGHGWSDPIVPFILGQEARDVLVERGYAVEWHQYAMEHSVSMEEIRDIGRWI